MEGVEELKLSSIDIHDDVHDIGSFRSPRSHRFVAGACAVVVNGAVVEGVEELKLSSIEFHDDVHDIGSFRGPRSNRRCRRCMCVGSQWSRCGGR